MNKLTTVKVKSAKPGRHGDGEGLYLLVKPSGGRSWLLRIQQNGKRRDIGLGSADVSNRSAETRRASDDIPLLSRRSLTLQEAREKAAELRKFALAGRDPITERDRERRKVPTFEDAAKACHEEMKGGWSTKQAYTFLASLERHAFPKLGKLTVDRIEASDIRDMLSPIWGRYSDMSQKVKVRVGQVLNFSHSKGWRPTEAPGRAVTMGLGKRAASTNLAAMPYPDVPAFFADVHTPCDQGPCSPVGGSRTCNPGGYRRGRRCLIPINLGNVGGPTQTSLRWLRGSRGRCVSVCRHFAED